MTEFLSSSFLAFIQGATEFLPISSSAHLVIVPHIFGWRDQGLAFDIAVHAGTLAASLTYFRDDIRKILVAWLKSLSGRDDSAEAKMGWLIVIASIPVALAGALFHELVENELRSPVVIASATVLFALLLWYADRFRRGGRSLNSLSWKDAVLIGLGQAVALIPGTSRSGMTITVGLLLGLSRKESAKFAFLLAIPAIAMAGGWQFLTLVTSDSVTDWPVFAYSAVISAVVAYLCIRCFLQFIERVGMMPFVLYRLALGAAIFLLV
ncbi:MAG: undecaprenyl-diphosphate phosphatase [Acidiferrobacterales bacterium]|nr:undecaprenyl-diphosphate phosphatase [Acidiferrobacterales bacterium]